MTTMDDPGSFFDTDLHEWYRPEREPTVSEETVRVDTVGDVPITLHTSGEWWFAWVHVHGGRRGYGRAQRSREAAIEMARRVAWDQLSPFRPAIE